MIPRLRRTVAHWLVHLAARIHPIRTLTDLRAVIRLEAWPGTALPDKPTPHRNHIHVTDWPSIGRVDFGGTPSAVHRLPHTEPDTTVPPPPA